MKNWLNPQMTPITSSPWTTTWSSDKPGWQTRGTTRAWLKTLWPDARAHQPPSPFMVSPSEAWISTRGHRTVCFKYNAMAHNLMRSELSAQKYYTDTLHISNTAYWPSSKCNEFLMTPICYYVIFSMVTNKCYNVKAWWIRSYSTAGTKKRIIN